MYNFCTLFNEKYLYRGLALHSSLLRHCSDFRLWILCMSNGVYDILSKLKLKNVILISLNDFEDKELLAIKKTRSVGEYCWTCTPSLPLYIFNNFKVGTIAYLDADLYFYSSPKPIYKEFGHKSIMVIPHNFSAEHKHLEKKSGIYNVGMLIFRNDKSGIKCLKWWRKKCNEWCYNFYSNGRFGDQLYLNDWPKIFENVGVLNHKGANLAPWNITQYKVEKKKNNIFINDDILIFYHFHVLKIYKHKDKIKLYNASLDISKSIINMIYEPYRNELQNIIYKNQFRSDENFDLESFNFKNNIINRLIKYQKLLKKNIFYRKFYDYFKDLIHKNEKN